MADEDLAQCVCGGIRKAAHLLCLSCWRGLSPAERDAVNKGEFTAALDRLRALASDEHENGYHTPIGAALHKTYRAAVVADETTGPEAVAEKTQAQEWHHPALVFSKDDGDRWHVQGEPVHAGTELILKVGANELRVSFETGRDGEPVLYVSTGSDIEDEVGRIHSPPRLVCRVEGLFSQLWLRWPPARRR